MLDRFFAWLTAPRCMRCDARLDKFSEPSLRFPDTEVECMACGCVQPKPKPKECK